MDRENLIKIKELIDELIGEDGERMPTEDQLDYDDDAVEIYNELRDLQRALENYGF